MIGQRLGHYRITEKIGAGGMGVVYRAHDEHLGRDVAVKVLPEGTLTDEVARRRFRKEAEALSKLNHSNIAVVHDFDHQDGVDFLVMEHLSGTTLAKRIAATGKLSQDEVRAVGSQIAAALEEAHEHGIVHRDLKPSNVMVTAKGQVKVLDFGLAKVRAPVADETATVTVTEEHTGAGTLPYMSPEQLRGEPADARSDIWALGVVLYEMASGTRPFRGQTSYQVSSAILHETPRPLAANLAPGLRTLIGRCLAKQPGERYGRASEVRAALGAIQADGESQSEGWSFPLPRRRWLAVAGGTVLLLAAVGTLNFGRLHSLLTGGPPQIQSLAVLPLENLSGDPAQDYLASGIHEALITDLARLSGLQRVVGRASVMRYRKTQEPLPQIARELGVDALITGSVLRSGDQVQITAHLIRGSTEEQLWADRYERKFRDVLSLENNIVSAITQAIRLHLTPEERTHLANARPVNPEAYDAYLRGMYHLNQFTPEGFEKGLKYLQQAIDKDPSNPLPYAGLALGYCLMGHERFPDAFIRAEAAAQKALELGGTLAETQLALGEIKFYHDWDIAGAEPYLRSALQLNPSLAEAHRQYSWYLNVIGSRDQAFAEMKRAEEVDPLTPLYPADLGWQYWLAGQYDDALAEARKSLDLNPNFAEGLIVEGYVYADKGMFDQAIAAHQKAAAADKAMRWPLAVTYVRAGRQDDARKLAAELEKQPTPVNAWGLTQIYAALGEKDEAFRWLNVAYTSRFSFMPWIQEDPFFASLRSDPRFQKILRNIKFPE
jgi:serine/threonine protein kinase/Flp pilus assembly protein TadD